MMRHALCFGLLALAACDDDGGPTNADEVITTVQLAFTPMGGGTPVTAKFEDLDLDGGNPPVIDPVNLPAGTYALAVSFLNALETPPEDITLEVEDEGDAHQVFFTGTAVDGPAANNPNAPLAHGYGDADVNGLPIGLRNTIVAVAGTGTLTVTLRHMPPINGNPVKTGALADTVKAMSLAALPGDSDANVNFTVSVQ